MSRSCIAGSTRRGIGFGGYLAGLVILILSLTLQPVSHGSSDPVLVGAGDIATCDSTHDEETAALLEKIQGTIFTTGDNAYPMGSAADFRDCYNPSWGRFKDRTRPAAGNHEYYTNSGAAYYDYFGAAAGPRNQGYYSYDLGAWHVVVLNSNIAIDAASEQIQWLRADLTSARRQCTVAYWHHPLFNSGNHGNNPYMRDAWHVLYELGVDVVVNGHDHNYERFAPQDPDGNADPRGIRQFIVGTGGGSLYPLKQLQPNSEIHNHATFGVLKLTLHPASYDWEFVPVSGSMFHDAGTAPCVDGTPQPRPPTIASVSPAAAPAGGATFTLRVNGTYFAKGSTIQWNGVDQPTTFVTSTQLTTTIPGAELVAPGTASVTVTDPAGASRSNPLQFMIFEALEDNLIDNGDFEDDTDKDDAADDWWDNEYTKRHAGIAYSGNASMRHYATDNAENVISQTVANLEGDKRYHFSAQVKIPPSNPLPRSFEFALRIRWRDPNKELIRTDILQVFKAATNGWQPITGQLQAPKGTDNAQVQMTVKMLNGVVYADHFVFRPLSTDVATAVPSAETSSVVSTPAFVFVDGPTPLPPAATPPMNTPTVAAATGALAIASASAEPTLLSAMVDTPAVPASDSATMPSAATSPAQLEKRGHTILGVVLMVVVVLQLVGLAFVIRMIKL